MTGSSSSWSEPGTIVKVSDTGAAMVVECRADGTAVERSIRNWEDPWLGYWSWAAGELSVTVGDFELRVPDGASRGTELRKDHWWVEPQDFYVFRAVEAEVPGGGGTALLKLTPSGIHAALLDDGGQVREFSLLDGSDADEWTGHWGRDGSLWVEVGSYRWASDRDLGLGCHEGSETGPDGESRFPAVLVELDEVATRAPLSRRREPQWLFSWNGYDFFRMPVSGYFARTMEARKASRVGADIRFAAKVTLPKEERAALREVELVRHFSAVDGIISEFEHFKLPDDPEVFREFAGAVVQILELGETSLISHLQRSAPLGLREALPLAREVASSLDALHTKFGYVHADVHLGNVIGRRAGGHLVWKLADFNVTTPIAAGRAPFLGSHRSCLSPSLAERIDEGNRWIEPSDDMWAYGLLVAQCFTGPLQLLEPVSAEDAADLIERCPAEVHPLLRGCLNPDPDARWTARKARFEAVRLEAHLTDELGPVVAGSDALPPTVPIDEPLPPTERAAD